MVGSEELADAFAGAEEADAAAVGPMFWAAISSRRKPDVVAFEDDAVVGGALLEDALDVERGAIWSVLGPSRSVRD